MGVLCAPSTGRPSMKACLGRHSSPTNLEEATEGLEHVVEDGHRVRPVRREEAGAADLHEVPQRLLSATEAEGTDEREERYGQRWGRASQRTSLSMTSSAEMQSCGLADGSLPAMYRWISDVGRSPTWVSLIYMTDTSSHQNHQFLPPPAAPHRHQDWSRYKCLLTRYVSTLGPAAAPPSSPPPPLPPASRQPHHHFHQILPALSCCLSHLPLPAPPFFPRDEGLAPPAMTAVSAA